MSLIEFDMKYAKFSSPVFRVLFETGSWKEQTEE